MQILVTCSDFHALTCQGHNRIYLLHIIWLRVTPCTWYRRLETRDSRSKQSQIYMPRRGWENGGFGIISVQARVVTLTVIRSSPASIVSPRAECGRISTCRTHRSSSKRRMLLQSQQRDIKKIRQLADNRDGTT